MGSRRLAHWIKLPLLSLDQIRFRQDLIELFYNDHELREALRTEHLKGIQDLEKLADKFRTKRAKLQDCLNLFDFVERLPNLLQRLQGYDGPAADLLQERYLVPLEATLNSFEPFRAMIRETIDLAAASNYEYMILPSFDDALKELADVSTPLSDTNTL